LSLLPDILQAGDDTSGRDHGNESHYPYLGALLQYGLEGSSFEERLVKGYLRPRLAGGQALLQDTPFYPLLVHLAQFHLVFPARVIEEDDPVARLQAEDVPYLMGQGAGYLYPFPLKPFWGDKETV
jgi:hypothetical protein